MKMRNLIKLTFLTIIYLSTSLTTFASNRNPNPNDTINQWLEFPKGDKSVLYPFFESLVKLKDTTQLIRVLHYGDSQIEGDRITSYIRNQLQTKFGGSGGGFVPMVQTHNYNAPITTTASEGWRRYGIIGSVKDSIVSHRRYGVIASFCRFAPLPVEKLSDSIGNLFPFKKMLEKKYTASASFTASKYSKKSVAAYKQCRLFYGYNQNPVTVKLSENDSIMFTDTLAANSKLSIKKWKFNKAPTTLTMTFEGSDSPEIYGVALDGSHGVAADNIPVRGCSGIIFSSVNQALLKEMYDSLHVKLIILQFGANAVPYMTDVAYYSKIFYSQLVTLRRLCPNIPIIVIGVQDMAKKDNDKYASYECLESLRDEMKKVTFNAHCIYWDMYEAMGGKNAMVKWVTEKLGEKDYVHFTPNGAQKIAKMFYNSLISEYNKYVKK